ncbi:MAG: hypothetical protein DRJ26_05375 [Candidatus Methanomethylicota archaeon]|uniref:PIN domain-containing protein n=1 Tax=Thermoproteota archaeon TaxID=2056631 RepID=A0A497EYT5_9CREN|nr:MAG: hypothetical protein DRJ26_05375 [Candidatus Verstraetearchaeota archaeon]
MILDSSAIYTIMWLGNLKFLKDASTSSLAKYELGNVIWKEVYLKKKLSIDEGVKILNLITRILKEVEVLKVNGLEEETLRLACNEGLTFYDAVYLQLAIKKQGSTSNRRQ